MIGPDDEFLPDINDLQLVVDAFVHSGAALLTDGDEPAVGRTLILELKHRQNGSSHTLEPTSTLFGMLEEHAVNLCGRLLLAIDLTFGQDAVRVLLTRVAEAAGAIAAAQDNAKDAEGENDDR